VNTEVLHIPLLSRQVNTEVLHIPLLSRQVNLLTTAYTSTVYKISLTVRYIYLFYIVSMRCIYDIHVFIMKQSIFQKEQQTNLTDVVYPKFLALFEKELEKNGGKYLVGNSVSCCFCCLCR